MHQRLQVIRPSALGISIRSGSVGCNSIQYSLNLKEADAAANSFQIQWRIFNCDNIYS